MKYKQKDMSVIRQYQDSWEQHQKDLEYIFEHIQDFPSTQKPMLKRLLKEHPNWDGFFQFGFDGQWPVHEELTNKIDYYVDLIEVLEKNLVFDKEHSNIPDDIRQKKSRLKQLYKELKVLRSIREYE